METPSTTEICSAMGELLVDDSTSDSPTPFKELLETKSLDFSYDSIQKVDQYLNEVHKRKSKLTNDEFIIVCARAGAYCGEVIRRNSKLEYSWIEYEEAVKIDPRVASAFGEKTIYTQYILFSPPQGFSTPLAKAGKFIVNGPEDALYGLVAMKRTQEESSS